MVLGYSGEDNQRAYFFEGQTEHFKSLKSLMIQIGLKFSLCKFDRSVIMITGSQVWFHLRLQNQCNFSYIWIISFASFQFNQMRIVDFQRQWCHLASIAPW
jgi:hypothetical protein